MRPTPPQCHVVVPRCMSGSHAWTLRSTRLGFQLIRVACYALNYAQVLHLVVGQFRCRGLSHSLRFSVLHPAPEGDVPYAVHAAVGSVAQQRGPLLGLNSAVGLRGLFWASPDCSDLISTLVRFIFPHALPPHEAAISPRGGLRVRHDCGTFGGGFPAQDSPSTPLW